MNKTETKRFNELYQCHLRLLKLQGKSQKTIAAYSRAIRRVNEYFGCNPDKLSSEQLEKYFAELVDTHSWSTVKIDRLGLQFFWKHVLKLDWQWLNIIKPPKIYTIPDILTPIEIEQLLGATRKLRYRVFLLATYSMGLRLEEALSLQVGDIDAERKRVHIRRGTNRGRINLLNLNIVYRSTLIRYLINMFVRLIRPLFTPRLIRPLFTPRATLSAAPVHALVRHYRGNILVRPPRSIQTCW